VRRDKDAVGHVHKWSHGNLTRRRSTCNCILNGAETDGGRVDTPPDVTIKLHPVYTVSNAKVGRAKRAFTAPEYRRS
jgi:hypothetical protein